MNRWPFQFFQGERERGKAVRRESEGEAEREVIKWNEREYTISWCLVKEKCGSEFYGPQF